MGLRTCKCCKYYTPPIHHGDITCAVNPGCTDARYCVDFELQVIWMTQEEELLKLEEMETSHLFNIVKMLFNHAAPIYSWSPVQLTKNYGVPPEVVARHLFWLPIFTEEIEFRKDLPEKYRTAWELIRHELKFAKCLECDGTGVTSSEDCHVCNGHGFKSLI